MSITSRLVAELQDLDDLEPGYAARGKYGAKFFGIEYFERALVTDQRPPGRYIT